MKPANQRGFTLIEVLIVVALIAFLVMSVAPLTGAWVRDADFTEVAGDLTQAVGRAKAAALRNHRAATGDEPVTAVCISGTHVLTVREGTSATAPDCTNELGTLLWTTDLDSDVTLVVNTNAVGCMCFNNKGMLTTTTTQCAACTTVANFSSLKLKAGNETRDIDLH